MVDEKNAPPGNEETIALIDEWLDHGGTIRLGEHLKVERSERNVTVRDCNHLLRAGRLSWPPEWDDRHGNRVFHVGGEDLDGELLEVLFVIDRDRGVLRFITAKPHYRGD